MVVRGPAALGVLEGRAQQGDTGPHSTSVEQESMIQLEPQPRTGRGDTLGTTGLPLTCKEFCSRDRV